MRRDKPGPGLESGGDGGQGQRSPIPALGRAATCPPSPPQPSSLPWPRRSDRFGPGGGVRRGGACGGWRSPGAAPPPPARRPLGVRGEEETPARSGGRGKREGSAGSRGAGAGPRAPSPQSPAWGLGRRRRPAGRERVEVWRRKGRRPGVSRRRRGRSHGGGRGRRGRRGGGTARTESPERRGRRGAKLAGRSGTSPAAAGWRWTPLRHGRTPQPGPRGGRLRRG